MSVIKSKKQNDPEPAVVRLVLDDLGEIMNIENQCYEKPWTLDNFLGEFKRPVTVPLGIKKDGRLAAQCFFWLLPPEIHLLNVAVHPDYRGQGLARKIMAVMIELGRAAGAKEVYLEVRPSNTPALDIYKSLGFLTSGLRPNYYDDNGEDAWLMTLTL